MKTVYMRLLTLLCFGLLCGSMAAQTQNIEFNKKNFPDNPEGFKTAKHAWEEGNKAFDNNDFPAALEQFLVAFAVNPYNAELNYKIGKIYVHTREEKRAVPYFEAALLLNPTIAPDIYYNLGLGYQMSMRFGDAITAFRKYKSLLNPGQLKLEGKMIDRRIYESENGMEFMKDTTRAFVNNMGANINSPCTDHSPVITADQSMMLFTSRRANSFNSHKDEYGEYDENIWYSTRKNGKWLPAQEMPKPINTKDNDATVGLSPDGQRLLIYNGKNGGDIFISEKRGNEWSSPKFFTPVNTAHGHEGNASFSFDGKTVYFTSDANLKITNYGEHDIFKCEMGPDGKWGKWINLGPIINTEYDEVDVFAHPDGRTLYFSSTGHKGMGDYDVFRTELQDDGTWSTPVNLGYPINTPASERAFVTVGSGRFGYYSAFRDGGMGRYDIYEIRFLGPPKHLSMSTENMLISALTNPIQTSVVAQEAVEIRTNRLTIFKGLVRDAETKNFLEASIVVTDNSTGQIISTLNSNAATGEFLVPLPSGKDYGIAVKKDGYLFYSENFNIPATTNYQEIVKEVDLLPLRNNATIVLRNVFFETASAKLDPKSNAELDNLIKIMKDNPKMVIEISGHTDNVGSRAYNQNLSENRAAAVVAYLSKQIDKSRLQYAGYGFDHPVASNDTADGRAENRRVEFKIISMN